jgi:site-specific DNA-adenine methylase
MVYMVLPINVSMLVMNLWQEVKEETNDVTRRINQLVEVQQNRAEVDEKLQRYKNNMKALFDKKYKDREFLPEYLVLKWDSSKEEARKNGKFDHIWCGPFRVVASKGKNSFLLENLNGKILNTPINGCYLKHFMQ